MKTEQDVYEQGLEIWNRWTKMWNEDPELAFELVAPRFVLHLTLPRDLDERTIDSPRAVREWVVAHCAKFTKLVFSTECGPYVDIRAKIVAGPWNADTATDGKPQPVCGMDTIRFDDEGRIVEYWTMSKPVDAYGRWAKSITP